MGWDGGNLRTGNEYWKRRRQVCVRRKLRVEFFSLALSYCHTKVFVGLHPLRLIGLRFASLFLEGRIIATRSRSNDDHLIIITLLVQLTRLTLFSLPATIAKYNRRLASQPTTKMSGRQMMDDQVASSLAKAKDH